MFDQPAKFVLPFGEYKGAPLDQVPLKYLDWLVGQSWLLAETRQVIETYLADPAIQKELKEELEG